ncbi:MAG TPA: SpoIIE family protein phosphatase [Spirochaetota bacterium]|nr:SpoIIE family protein phosphatase [Spirochaetota bacterium]HOM38286.1 SpoIIE family protein phosphatase [Spirochaetota bacterium]HPQ48496.1 SpoIIE family protein phosphatase [Spirochaetota bacterium]
MKNTIKKLKKYTKLIILTILLILMVILLILNKEYILNDLSKREAIENPDNIFIDEATNIYFSDKEMKRITKIDIDGNVKIKIDGDKREKGFYRISEIVSDKDGDIFLINFVYSEENIYVDRTEVQMFDLNGNFKKVIFDITCSTEEEKEDYYNSYPYSIMGLKIINNNLFFTSFDLSGNIIIWYYDKKSDVVKKLNSYPITKDNSVNKVFISESGNIYIIKKDGNLYKYDSNKNLKKIETGIENQKIWSITESQTNIYISDIFSRKIFYLNQDKKTFEFIKNLKEKDLYYNISANQNYIAGVNDSTNSIDIFNKNGNKIKTISEVILTKSEIFTKVFIWIVSLISVILLIYVVLYIYLKILDKYLPLTIKQIIIFVPILIISLYITSTRVYKSLFEKYENEIKNELSALAQLGARMINYKNIIKIKSPFDYQKDDYNNLKSELTSILNEYQDPWNKNLFNTVYVLKNNIFYIICNDSTYYGTWYPYIRHPDIHYETYKNNGVNSSKYSDQHGDYFVGISVIKDENNNPVALYEVGFYQDYANEFNNIFRKKLLSSVIFSSILYILIFVISTYFILKALSILKNGVKKIINGYFGVEIKIKRKDELGDLANGFNYMSKKLKDYINEITNLNKNLEKKVEERTAELQKAYKEIEKRNKQIENDIKMASIIQKNMLPKTLPPSLKTGIYTIYKPMEMMGGDFYDFVPIDEDKLGIFISDVSGHGVPAAFITSMIKTLITTMPDKTISPKEFLKFINNNIYNQTSGNFITAFYGILDQKNMTLRYAKASHPEPILIKNNGQISLLEGKGNLLGVFEDISIEEYEIKLEPKDKIIFYTDGLIEAVNKYLNQFESEFLKIVDKNYSYNILSLIDTIIEELEKYWVSQEDDVCIIGIEMGK